MISLSWSLFWSPESRLSQLTPMFSSDHHYCFCLIQNPEWFWVLTNSGENSREWLMSSSHVGWTLTGDRQDPCAGVHTSKREARLKSDCITQLSCTTFLDLTETPGDIWCQEVAYTPEHNTADKGGPEAGGVIHRQGQLLIHILYGELPSCHHGPATFPLPQEMLPLWKLSQFPLSLWMSQKKKQKVFYSSRGISLSCRFNIF